MVAGGILYRLADHAVLVASEGSERLGFAVVKQDRDEPELLALLAVPRQSGIGSALLRAVERDLARPSLLTVRTTNDNLEALRFYQRRGFHLSGLRVGAFEEVRRIKSLTPGLTGQNGIELRDELVLTKRLEPTP